MDKEAKKEEKTVTIKKSTLQLVAVFVVALVIGYGIGFVTAPKTVTGQVIAPSQQQTGQQPEAPAKVSVSLDDDPTFGDKNAPVQVIEFSDFQCPFCRRFFTQTLSQIENDYVKTGKVLFVYRDFPLESLHPSAMIAAEAAECAKDQGKWKEMHDKIFTEQQTLRPDGGTATFTAGDLKTWAADIKLDKTKFDTCIDSGAKTQEIQKDFQDGASYGVTGTPTFFIGNQKDGYTEVVGAQPYSVIKQAIDAALSS